MSAKHNHLDAVKLLLPFSDPLAYGSETLIWAAVNNNEDMFEFLLPYCNTESAKSYIRGGLGFEPQLAEWSDAQVQRVALNEAVGVKAPSFARKRVV